MKANELSCRDLMVGDWVRIKITQHNTTVTNIDANSVYTEAAFPIRYDKIEPILLTPEILEKNGFTLKEEEKGMYGVTIAPYYTRDDVPFEVFCDGEPFAIWFKDPVNIKYVHELQRALRLCGINREIII